MCGIAGIIQASPRRYEARHLQAMTDALAHRGPDGEGHWQEPGGQVWLGHRRLAILDLTEAGRQPFAFGQRYTLVHNGEIYNYRELREELEKKGYVFRTQTDTEVVAAAYDCWKKDCVTRFDGMFAFALWDEKEKTLFAARDRFGEKPFFYYFDGEVFLFASEMKALWAAGISRRPNGKMLFNFLTIGYADNPDRPDETFFEDIFRLPAAHCLEFSLVYFSLRRTRYWQLDPERVVRPASDSAAVEQFAALLQQSVRRRLRSDVPVGGSLSGGLDSASVMNLAAEGAPAFTCFTASFPGYEKDETGSASWLADHAGLSHFTVDVKGEQLLADWQQLSWHQEEPMGSASTYAQYRVYGLAAEQGTKVLLDGQGADEILAGYSRYYKWYWQELFRRFRLRSSGELEAARALGVKEPFDFRHKIAAYFPAFASIVLERRYLLQALRHPHLTAEFVRQQSRDAYYTTPDYFTLNGALYFNTCVHGLEELLRYADRSAMAHGRELRLPFLSHELVEFVFSLPPSFKIRNGRTKWILRESMKDRLPGQRVWNTEKIGFEPPQHNWMQLPAWQEAIREARRLLVDQQILKPELLDQPVQPHGAHEAAAWDWRYFSAAALFRSA